jgi:multiple sugar transport system permease protein
MSAVVIPSASSAGPAPANSTSAPLPKPPRGRAATIKRGFLHAFLLLMAVGWLIPIVGAVYSSLRPYEETSEKGFLSWPDTFTLDNYRNAWNQGDMTHHYLVTAMIVIPAVLITLLLSSFVAFGVSRFSWRFNIALLLLFTAGNLLPPQVLAQPLFQMYKRIPLPGFLSDTGYMLGSTLGLITIHVAFQMGFCVFVLSNYMKTLPVEIGEAAKIDGASVLRQFFQIILPLCRPPLAALGTLLFTWVFNDFFWAVLLENQGADRPITSSLANLGGQFFTNDNLVAAGSMLVAFPTIAVYLVLQRQFVGGLTLGSTKG